MRRLQRLDGVRREARHEHWEAEGVAEPLLGAETCHERVLVVEYVRLRLAGERGCEELLVAMFDLIASLDEELDVRADGAAVVRERLTHAFAQLPKLDLAVNTHETSAAR